MVVSKKQHITLLEVLIAMGLLSILLTAVFSIYSQISLIEIEAKKDREENFRILYAQYRLSKVIPNTLDIVGEEPLPFYMDYQSTPYHTGDSLVFVYDNKVDGNPEFSNALLARLYVDLNGNLSIATWPWKSNPAEGTVAMRREILLENVKEVNLLFYAAQKREERKKAILTGDEALLGGWHSNWPLETINPDEAPGIPAIIKMNILIENEEKPIELTYVLPNANESILYTR